MNIPLRVLLIEDADRDVALEVRALEAAGYLVTYTVVDTAAEMKAALAAQAFDIVLSDHDLPQFDAPGALAVLKESALDIPFVIVSGAIGEEAAVAVVKAGAHDYVTKDSLSRLAIAVEHALQDEEDRHERREAEKRLQLSEERYRTLVEKAFEGIIVIQDGKIVFANPRAYEIIDYPRDQTEPTPFVDFVHAEDRELVIDRHLKRLKGEQLEEVYPIRLTDQQGNIKWAQISAALIDWEGKPATLTLLTDISERKKAEEALLESEQRVRLKLDAILSPLGDIGKLELMDVVNTQAIQLMMDDFFKLTTIGIAIIDLNGNVLVATGWQDICTQFHRIHPETCKNCVESDTLLSEGVEEGKYKVYKCKNNMWDMVTPITVGGKHIGNLFLGQFLFEDEVPDYEFFRSQAQKYGFNEEHYIAALERVPRWNRETVDTVMAFYSKFARLFSSLSHSNIKLAHSLAEKDSLLNSLRQSEDQYHLLSEHTTDTVWLMDMNLNITYHSPSGERLRGLTPQEIMEMPIEQHLTPESLKLAFELFFKEISRVEADPGYNPVITLDLEYYRKDGTTVWAESKFSIIRDGSGKAVSILGEGRDITERKLSEEKLLKSYESIRKTLNDAINTMVKIVEMRDPYTAGHQQRVANLAIAIAREMKLEETRIDQLKMAAVIHDIGKMYIPSDILSRPGRLSDIEFNLIKTHSQSGYDIVKGMDFPCSVADAVLQHHERLDGSGYPNGLKGDDMLTEAKILAVADVIEAMASHRPYRPAQGIDKALEEISKNRGKLYDPGVVDACLEVFKSGRFEFKPV